MSHAAVERCERCGVSYLAAFGHACRVPLPGQWARPQYAHPLPFCRVLAVQGGSVVTACRGRWQVAETELVFDVSPTVEHQCSCCRGRWEAVGLRG